AEDEEESVSVNEIDLDEILASGSAAASTAPPAPAKPPTPAKEEPEFELDQEYELMVEPESLVPAHEQRPPEAPAAPEPEPVAQSAAPTQPANGGFASDQFLSDLANDIDQLGIGQLTPTFSAPAPAAPAPPVSNNGPAPVETGPLKEVFEEFRAEL